jgi:hypothetical protein
MTRKQATLLERVLRQRGVYRPYVSMDADVLAIESYPLTAYVRPGAVDPEMGPVQCVRISDCTRSRDGLDSTLTTARVFIGQDVIQTCAQLLLDFHGPAHARAMEQDKLASVKVA